MLFGIAVVKQRECTARYLRTHTRFLPLLGKSALQERNVEQRRGVRRAGAANCVFHFAGHSGAVGGERQRFSLRSAWVLSGSGGAGCRMCRAALELGRVTCQEWRLELHAHISSRCNSSMVPYLVRTQAKRPWRPRVHTGDFGRLDGLGYEVGLCCRYEWQFGPPRFALFSILGHACLRPVTCLVIL